MLSLKVRSEADEILLRHAQEHGVKVFEGVKVDSIDFENETRPRVAHYVSKDTGEKGQISFDYVVDASGRQGVLSTKYLHNRVYNQGLKNIATWGYWRDCGVYEEGTDRADVPYFEALADESGWAWFIPLHGGITSVGVVMTQDSMNSKKRNHPSGKAPTSEQFYVEQLQSMTPAHPGAHPKTERWTPVIMRCASQAISATVRRRTLVLTTVWSETLAVRSFLCPRLC